MHVFYVSPYVDFLIYAGIFSFFAWLFGSQRSSFGILVYWLLSVISNTFLTIQLAIWAVALFKWIWTIV